MDYYIDPPRYSIDECLERGLTYSVPLKAKMKLYCTDPDHEDFGTFIQDVFLGTIPYMTDNGTFVINGAERVVVSQLHRSPGVFFGQGVHANGTVLYSARIIPFKGSWIEFATDINNVMYAYIDRKKKLPVTTLLRAMGFEQDKDILQIFDLAEEVKVNKKNMKAAIGRNEAQKEIALSNAQLSVTQANADKEAGEAAARSEAAVQTARERAQKEVEEAKALKVESSLKAEKIVPAEVAKQEAILQADAVAEKVIREAEAKAKATLAQAEAEAKAIRMRLEAEAEGKKMSLLAEADGFQAMVKAAELNPAIAIQYKMVDQWKEIAGEQVKAFEKLQLGNVTVFDGGDGATGNFLNSLVKTVAPSLGVLDQLPIGETVKKILHPEQKEETEKEGTEKKDEK